MAKSLAQQILSATKTLNSRLRRLRAEDLPATSEQRLREIQMHRPGFVTPKGFVSSSVKGMTEQEMKEKLRMIRGLLQNTETVPQARENLEQKRKQWNVSKEEARERIRAGRVFYQVLGYRGGIFDSDRVHIAIEEFEKTPTYNELIDKIYYDYGSELQNEVNGRENLLNWMNEKRIIPPYVEAVYDGATDRIVYGYINSRGEVVQQLPGTL